MSEHTPGPWVKSNWKIIDEANRTVICNVLPWDVSGCREEDVDNAHLIAAAPDLLEALEIVADALQSDNPDMQLRAELTARAAIAKAKGEFS